MIKKDKYKMPIKLSIFNDYIVCSFSYDCYCLYLSSSLTLIITLFFVSLDNNRLCIFYKKKL